MPSPAVMMAPVVVVVMVVKPTHALKGAARSHGSIDRSGSYRHC
jgi:hypothetical protein